jgi:EAL domain-containing protein (putative c-di-GMP-specific phosphodiesterase class I)
LVQTIVFFAKKRNIKTIAEFVENEEIYNILKDLGVDYSQGHYFSKAGLLKEFIPSAL